MQQRIINILFGVIVVILTGVVVYLTFGNKSTPVTDITPAPVKTTVKPPVVATDQTSNSASLNDDLVKAKFELAILKFWQVNEVFQNPQDKNKFYYVSGDSSGASIGVYDLAQDKTYQQNGSFNIPEGNTMLFNQKLVQYQEFRGVGFSGNKFVFVETSSENSPGPCSSSWFYSNLQYIDLGVSNPTPKPFIVPADLKKEEEQKSLTCQKAIEDSQNNF